MLLIDFSLLFTGFPINKTKKKLEEIQELNGYKLNEFIEFKKREIVDFHIQNNSFYNELVKHIDYKKWNKLPVLTKKDLQKELIKRLSKGYNPKNIYVNKTSGSTGDPFYFAKDKYTHALTWSNIKFNFNNHKLYGTKQARFYGIPKHGLPRIKERLKDFFSNRYRFNVFDLSDEALKKWVYNFKKNKYIYLNGYTTVLVVFAEYLINNNLVLKKICPTIKACVVTSEMCSDSDREKLEKGLGVKVINEYGASELDLIAFEDENLDWVVNRQTLFIEILDNENNNVEYGKEGRIVITSLFNKAHPFIRYEIGDRGILENKGGKIILKKLIGRKEDLIHLPSGKTCPGLTFYYVTKSVMEDNDNIREIKIIQSKLNTFEVHYSSKYVLKESQIKKINEALLNYLEPNLVLNFVRKDKIERSKSGKLKQFTSLIN